MKHLFTLNRYFVKYKWHLILGIVFDAGSNYFGILIPQKIREALDLVHGQITLFKQSSQANPDISYDELNRSLLYFGLIITVYVIIKGLLKYFMRQTIIVMSRLIEYDIVDGPWSIGDGCWSMGGGSWGVGGVWLDNGS